MSDLFSEIDPKQGASLLSSVDNRSFAIPLQYAAGTVCFRSDGAGKFPLFTNQRTMFSFGQNDAPTTDVSVTGIKGTLADFAPGTGTDTSIITSIENQGGNAAPDGLFSLALGSALAVTRIRLVSDVAAATVNYAVEYGGQVSSIPTWLQARAPQFVQAMMANAVVQLIPNGNNPQCGARVGKLALMPNGSVGLDSAAIPQVGAKSGTLITPWRQFIPAQGSTLPQQNFNRANLIFGSVDAGDPANSTGQSVVVEQAPGDPVVTAGYTVAVDFLYLTAFAIIEPNLVDQAISMDRGDGTMESTIVKTYKGHTVSDQQLMNAYRCRRGL